MKNFKAVYMLAILALLLSSCATVPVVISPGSDASDSGSVSGEDYLLGPDDIVHVTVDQHPEWSGDFLVRPNGSVYIPNLEEVDVEGLSGIGAELRIASHLEKLINNPKVTVDILKYESQVIYVLGEVNRPGKYSTGGKSLTLRDAVILAGLPAHFASDGSVYVITPGEGRPQQQVINLHRILYRGEMDRNVALKAGDIVFIPKNIWGRISDLFSVILSPLTTARSALIVP